MCNATHQHDKQDHQPLQSVKKPTAHEYDDDAVCIHCGFDGAEWHHWKHHTWEGQAQPEAMPPRCIRA